MKDRSPEVFRPMVMLGQEVLPGAPEKQYDQPLGPEEDAKFDTNLAAISEAERLGRLEGDSIILG
jgi:hypothetical protein